MTVRIIYHKECGFREAMHSSPPACPGCGTPGFGKGRPNRIAEKDLTDDDKRKIAAEEGGFDLIAKAIMGRPVVIKEEAISKFATACVLSEEEMRRGRKSGRIQSFRGDEYVLSSQGEEWFPVRGK